MVPNRVGDSRADISVAQIIISTKSGLKKGKNQG